MKVLLIVDDEAYARQAVANTISWAEHGIEVHQVSSGKEALDFMEKRTVDVLMTDIRMPSMTGLELLEKVYQNGWSPAAIVLSSFNEFELVRSAMQLGAEDYLFKPTMMPTDILESVQRVLEKKKETKKKAVQTISKKEILERFLPGRKGFQGEIRNFRGAVAGIRDNGVCNCQCPVDEISGLSGESVW